jgi:CAAX prenyl protease-like protein
VYTPIASEGLRLSLHTSRAWLPHVAPYVLFLVLVELGRWLPLPPGVGLCLKVAIPAAVLLAFALRGCYPELRVGSGGAAGWIADVAVGLGVAALWMAPYVSGLLPHPTEGFDAGVFGVDGRSGAWALRGLGFVVVTPFVEELFVRSFLIRFAELISLRGGRLEIDTETDFRSLPVARYSRAGFWITVAWFTFSHVSWEMPVAFATGVIYNLWLYRRGHLGAVVRAHAVTNGTLFACVLLDGRLGYFL